jgi:hypothetical protein
MKNVSVMAAGVSAAVLIGAAPAKKDAAPPPIANYWMDVSTTSGFGAAMMGGGRPNPAAIMAMMNGGGASAVGHSLNLRLSSRDKPSGAPEASHFIPSGMDMGPSLPLLSPEQMQQRSAGGGEPGQYEKPKGRMLIYWGCGEHAAAPVVIDFAKVAAGQIPPGIEALSRMGRSMGHMAMREPTAENSAAFGEWPNRKDSRPVPASATLVGAHRVEGNYSPAIAFTLGQGEDFMPGLGLREAGALPSGAERLDWMPAAQATGYALALFGGGMGGGGDIIVWTSAKSASLTPSFDYETPAEARTLVANGAALPPGTSECVLPAEVSRAVPQGMVMMIGYGPQASFSDKPKDPTWTARVRYKTTAMLMRGMGNMGMGGDDGGYATNDQPPQQPQQPQQPQPKKHRGIGIGDLLGGIPH